MDDRPLGQERRVDVDVEPVEQLAVDGDARRALRPDGGRGQCQVPLAEADAAHDDVGQVDVARQLGALGAPADVQLGAHEAAHGDARVGGAGNGRDRILRERDVEVEILVREADVARDVDGATPAVGDPQRLDGERLAVERQVHGPEGELVAQGGDGRAGRDRHVRRDGIERAVRVGVRG